MIRSESKNKEIQTNTITRGPNKHFEADPGLQAQSLELRKTNEDLIRKNQNLQKEIAKQAQELEQSERRYSQIIDNATDLIYRTDANGVFTYINSVVYNKLGYELEEVIGKLFIDFIDPDYKLEAISFYYNIRRTLQERSYFELPILSKSGEKYWIGQNTQLLIENNRVTEITAVARDITEQKETEEALRTTERRLTALIDNLQSAVLVEDEMMTAVFANQKFCDLFSLNTSQKNIRGRSCGQISGSIATLFEDPEGFEKKTKDLLTVGTVSVGEELIMKNGTILERDYVPIYIQNKYFGHFWNYRNVTTKRVSEKILRQSEEKYRGIIENMELGLMEVDLDHNIVRAYNLFCEMTGYSSTELIGKNALETFIPSEYHFIFNHWQEKKLILTQVNEVQIRRKDGKKIWALVSGAPIYNETGNIVGSINIYYDITDRKKLENDLASAKKRAEEAQEVEQQFLARMSHEIRTPLNAIIGMAHLLYDTNPNDEQREYLTIVKSSADLLLGIISNILDFSKIQAGEFEFKQRKFDLNGLIKTITKTFQLKVEEKKKTIEVQAFIDPKISNLLIGDDLILNQVFMNLLGNALKFTSEGVIGVKVEEIENRGVDTLLEFTVYDSGIGIPDDQIEHIFKNFKQADHGIREELSGTGLGLAITKQYIELQNGKINVTSQEGIGTSFVFTLPFLNSDIQVEPSSKEYILNQENVDATYRILVAEDNLLNRKYISSLLNKWNIDFVMASDGKVAYQEAQLKKFNLILMDISMPEMDGYEATIAIRNTTNPNQQTPIIALTASALISTKEKVFQIGMSGFLTKPFKPFQLMEFIQEHDTANKTKETDESLEFTFDSRLDITYLKEMYDGDLEYASDIFEIFLEQTIPELEQLKQHIEKEDWDETRRVAHKIKPTFAMVGLTMIQSMMLQIEKCAGERIQTDQLPQKLDVINDRLDQLIPVLKNDLLKMRNEIKMV